MRVSLEESFILHTRPFRDTSLLLNIFSKNHGHLMLLARGAKSHKSRLRAILTPFIPLIISWSGKTELPTASKIEPSGVAPFLSGNALLCGMYLNELLVRLLHRFDPHPNLYTHYSKTLHALATEDNLPPILRSFEKTLLNEIGYGLQFDKDINGEAIESNAQYYFDFGHGFRKITTALPNQGNIFSGKSILALHNAQFTSTTELIAAEKILSIAINSQLGGRILKSKELMRFC
jgi:DNA repair protein RecO (recombination protein O)